MSIVDERRGELVEEVKQLHQDPEQRIGRRSVAQVAVVIIGREMQDDQRRQQLVDRLTARLSPEAQEYLGELDGWRRARQLWWWVYDAMGPKFGPQNLERFFTDKLTNDQREYLLGLPLSDMKDQLQQMYLQSQVGLRPDDFPRRFGRRTGWPRTARARPRTGRPRPA